jgi:PAS domain S-box-containing protein
MVSSSEKHLSIPIKLAAPLGSLIAGGIAVLVLVGWLVHSHLLTSFITGLDPSRPNTAASLLLSALALWILREPRAALWRRTGQVLAILPVLIAALCLGEDLLGRNIPFEEWAYSMLLRRPLNPEHLSMSPLGAVSFICLGIGLLVLRVRTPGGHSLGQWMCVLPLMLSLSGIVGYAYGADLLYGRTMRIPMALPSAIGLLALSLGAICARPDLMPAAILQSDNAGGYLARRLLPAALVFPICFGFLRMLGQQAGLYGAEFGLAMFTIANVVFFSIVIIWVASKLARIDSQRLLNEEALQESQEQYRALSDATFDALVLHENGVVLEVNQAFTEMLGYTRKEVVGRQSLQSVVAPESLPIMTRHIREGFEGPYEAILMRKDDSRLTVEIQAKNTTYRGRRVRVASAHDITERIRSEAELKEQEERFRATFNNAAVAIAHVGLDGRWLRSNDCLGEITGYSREELLNLKFQDITHPDDIAPDLAQAARLLSGEISNYSMEKRYIRKTGSAVWILLTGSVVRRPDGAPDYFIAVVQDIGERKRAEEALRRSEERWAWALRGIGVGVWDWNLKDDTVFFSKLWKEMLGYEEGEISNKLSEWSDRVHPDDFRRAMDDVRAHFEGLTPLYTNEQRIRHKDGSWRWIQDCGIVIRNASGEPVRMIGSQTDVTERKRAEEALQQSEHFYRQTVDSIPGMVFTNLPDGNCDFVSEQWVNFTGIPAEQHMGRGWAKVLHPEDRQSTLDAWQAAVDGSGRYDLEYRIRRKDGEHLWFKVRSRPIKDRDGQVVRWFGTAVNIHDLKNTEDELRRLKDELELRVQERTEDLTALNRELERFSYSLSHDLRTPLRAMRGFCDILEAEHESELSGDVKMYLKKISSAAARLDQLVKDVLTYSRVLRGDIQVEPIDMEDLIRQLVEENPALQLPAAVITIGAPLHHVLGQKAYLTQVLSNLIYNAVKFVAPDQQPMVQIWTELFDSEVRLLVRDNGIGIPKDARGRMFALFQRLHTEQGYEGTGIGLTIVRTAVERMGGCVGVESEPGKGSTFWFQLRKAGQSN